jgi:hypothetical protein
VEEIEEGECLRLGMSLTSSVGVSGNLCTKEGMGGKREAVGYSRRKDLTKSGDACIDPRGDPGSIVSGPSVPLNGDGISQLVPVTAIPGQFPRFSARAPLQNVLISDLGRIDDSPHRFLVPFMPLQTHDRMSIPAHPYSRMNVYPRLTLDFPEIGTFHLK